MRLKGEISLRCPSPNITNISSLKSYPNRSCIFLWCLVLLRLCSITVYRNVFGVCAVLMLNAFVLFSLVIIILRSSFIVMVTAITGMFMLWLHILNHGFKITSLGNSGVAIVHLRGCFCPWAFFQNIGLNITIVFLLISLC